MKNLKSFLVLTGILLFITTSIFSQQYSKSLATCKELAAAKGYTLKKVAEDFYTYMRYDELGDVQVLLKCDGDIVRQVIMQSTDALKTMGRWKEVFKNMRPEELTQSDDPQVVICSSSMYYPGRARYMYENDWNKKIFRFSIIPLD